MEFCPILVFFLLFIPVILVLKKKLFNDKQREKLPPSPPKLPFLGNLQELGSLPHRSLWKLSKKYGPVMLLQLGNVQTVVVSSADAAKAVLKTHDVDSCSRPLLHGPRLMTYNFLDLAFTPYSDYWREIRKICVLELYSVKRTQSYRSIREEAVAEMINSIANHSSVDLTEKLFALPAGIIFRVAFGRSFQGSDLYHSRFHELVQAVAETVGSFCAAEYFPYVGWIVDRLLGLQRRRQAVFQEMDSFFQRVIDEHKNPNRGEQEHEDIIDVFLKIVKEKAFEATSLSETNIKAVLLNIFLGGVDTAAITMEWTMAELVKRPNLMKKAQDEVRALIGDKGSVTESDIDQLQYLKMVIKEIYRLHPPAPLLIPRETMRHFKIDGYDIPAKTMLYVNVWATGRDPKYWNDPEEFNPDRFVDSPVDFRGQHFELLPFGSGRRVCPAMFMGETMVELGLANLLYSFNWKLPHGMKEEDINMEETTGLSLTVSKKTPLILVPVKHS